MDPVLTPVCAAQNLSLSTLASAPTFLMSFSRGLFPILKWGQRLIVSNVRDSGWLHWPASVRCFLSCAVVFSPFLLSLDYTIAMSLFVKIGEQYVCAVKVLETSF